MKIRSLPMLGLALSSLGLLASCESEDPVTAPGAVTQTIVPIPWQSGVVYDSVSDAAGQSYRTVRIGTLTWMAENLNYAGATGAIGKCYGDNANLCTKYGRLYTWAEVLQGAAVAGKVQGLCPTGWHVPTDTEWVAMETAVTAGRAADAAKLRSIGGWNRQGNGTDSTGFRALPGGFYSGTAYGNLGDIGYWWTASESSANSAWIRSMISGDAYLYRYANSKAFAISLRCVKD